MPQSQLPHHPTDYLVSARNSSGKRSGNAATIGSMAHLDAWIRLCSRLEINQGTDGQIIFPFLVTTQHPTSFVL